MILVHGFGASARQWRKVIPVLAKTNKVRPFTTCPFSRVLCCEVSVQFIKLDKHN